MKRKNIGIFSVCVLLVLSLVLTCGSVAFAKTNLTEIKLESKTIKAGETVTLDLLVNNNQGFSALYLAFIYNTDYLTLKKIENKAPSFSMTANKSVVWDALENYNENGVLATLTFEVADNIPKGDYEIQVIFMGAANDSFEEVEMNAVSAKLTVKGNGDLNNDNFVDGTDYQYIADIYTGKIKVDNKLEVCDLNGDGKFDIRDVIAIREIINA